jgi:hypothetical protein
MSNMATPLPKASVELHPLIPVRLPVFAVAQKVNLMVIRWLTSLGFTPQAQGD